MGIYFSILLGGHAIPCKGDLGITTQGTGRRCFRRRSTIGSVSHAICRFNMTLPEAIMEVEKRFSSTKRGCPLPLQGGYLPTLDPTGQKTDEESIQSPTDGAPVWPHHRIWCFGLPTLVRLAGGGP